MMSDENKQALEDFAASRAPDYLKDKTVETIQAALTVLQKMASGDDWFDIKSAPRDGTEILACENGYVWFVRFDKLLKDFADPDSFVVDNLTQWKHIDGAKHINMMMERELGNEIYER